MIEGFVTPGNARLRGGYVADVRIHRRLAVILAQRKAAEAVTIVAETGVSDSRTSFSSHPAVAATGRAF